jgi:glycine/D-amino acid oxidase-like deaminating enzyme
MDRRKRYVSTRFPGRPTRVVTDAGTFEADILVVALGADLDPSATPGLIEGGNEFYTVAGASALREVLTRFERGPAIIGITGKLRGNHRLNGAPRKAGICEAPSR